MNITFVILTLIGIFQFICSIIVASFENSLPAPQLLEEFKVNYHCYSIYVRLNANIYYL